MSETGEKLASIIASVVNQTVMPMIDELRSEIRLLKTRVQEQEASLVKGLLTASMERVSEMAQEKTVSALSPLRKQIDEIKKLIETKTPESKESMMKELSARFSNINSTVERLAETIQGISEQQARFSKIAEDLVSKVENMRTTVASQATTDGLEPLKKLISSIDEALRGLKEEISLLRGDTATIMREISSMRHDLAERIESLVEEGESDEEILKDYRPRRRGRPPSLPPPVSSSTGLEEEEEEEEL